MVNRVFNSALKEQEQKMRSVIHNIPTWSIAKKAYGVQANNQMITTLQTILGKARETLNIKKTFPPLSFTYLLNWILVRKTTENLFATNISLIYFCIAGEHQSLNPYYRKLWKHLQDVSDKQNKNIKSYI